MRIRSKLCVIYFQNQNFKIKMEILILMLFVEGGDVVLAGVAGVGRGTAVRRGERCRRGGARTLPRRCLPSAFPPRGVRPSQGRCSNVDVDNVKGRVPCRPRPQSTDGRTLERHFQ
jgi:hypothetical protein